LAVNTSDFEYTRRAYSPWTHDGTYDGHFTVRPTYVVGNRTCPPFRVVETGVVIEFAVEKREYNHIIEVTGFGSNQEFGKFILRGSFDRMTSELRVEKQYETQNDEPESVSLTTSGPAVQVSTIPAVALAQRFISAPRTLRARRPTQKTSSNNPNAASSGGSRSPTAYIAVVATGGAEEGQQHTRPNISSSNFPMPKVVGHTSDSSTSERSLPLLPTHPSLLDNTGGSRGTWTTAEHELFLQGLTLHKTSCGTSQHSATNYDWLLIAAMVKTRTPTQCRTHAQKHFTALGKGRVLAAVNPVTVSATSLAAGRAPAVKPVTASATSCRQKRAKQTPPGASNSMSHAQSLKKGAKVIIMKTDNVEQRAPHLIGQVGKIKDVPQHPNTWFKVEFNSGHVFTFRPSALRLWSEGARKLIPLGGGGASKASDNASSGAQFPTSVSPPPRSAAANAVLGGPMCSTLQFDRQSTSAEKHTVVDTTVRGASDTSHAAGRAPAVKATSHAAGRAPAAKPVTASVTSRATRRAPAAKLVTASVTSLSAAGIRPKRKKKPIDHFEAGASSRHEQQEQERVPPAPPLQRVPLPRGGDFECIICVEENIADEGKFVISSCGHSLCLHCVQRLAGNGKDMFVCPFCASPITNYAGAIAELKPVWASELSDGCVACDRAGILICCDGCNSGYHFACAGLEPGTEPEVWFCVRCQGNETASRFAMVLYDTRIDGV
jgi:hypothetical protein